MLLDNAFKFSVDQALTASAISTNQLNIGTARKLFGGFNKWTKLVVNCTAHTGTCTVAIALTPHDDTAASNSGGTILAVGATEHVAGNKVEFLIPPQHTARQYYAVYYTVSGSTSTTLDCYIAEAEQENLLS